MGGLHIETQASSLCRHVNNSNERKGTFHNSSYSSIRYVSGAAAATVFCSSGRRGKERGREKKTLRSADSVLHARAPVRTEGEGKKRKVKGVGDRKRERKKPLTHYLWQENHPRAERHLGYQYRLLFSFGSFPHSRQ